LSRGCAKRQETPQNQYRGRHRLQSLVRPPHAYSTEYPGGGYSSPQLSHGTLPPRCCNSLPIFIMSIPKRGCPSATANAPARIATASSPVVGQFSLIKLGTSWIAWKYADARSSGNGVPRPQIRRASTSASKPRYSQRGSPPDLLSRARCGAAA